MALLQRLHDERRRRVEKARAQGDRYRKQSATPRTRSVTIPPRLQSQLCSDCREQKRYAGLVWCRKCALGHGFAQCRRCGALCETVNMANSDRRCRRCLRKPMCKGCGRKAPVKGSSWCHACSLQHGWKACSSCSKLFLPPPGETRRRRCPKCLKKGKALGRRGSGTSVYTVSGGLPSLGRHHS